MSRDDGGYWVPIHPGLLRDELWVDLTPAQRGAWVTLFLLLDGEPRRGWFKTRARAAWLLEHHGVRRGRAVVDELAAAGWIEPEGPDSPAVTLRGWLEYTARGMKALWNQDRGDRGDRSAEYAKRNARRRAGDRGRPRELAGDLDKTRPDDQPSAGLDAGAGAAESAPAPAWRMPPFEELMRKP